MSQATSSPSDTKPRTASAAGARGTHTGRDGGGGPTNPSSLEMPPSSEAYVATIRRRDRGGANSDPDRERAAGTSWSRERASRSAGEQGRRERENKVSSVAANNFSVSGRRNPVPRYLVLSGGLVMAGFAVRYFWRQLAGLAGGLLILAAARRASIGREPPAKRRPKKDEVIRSTENDTLARVPQRDDTKVTHTAPPKEESSLGVKQADSVATPADITKVFTDSPSEMRRYWVDAGKECSFVVRGRTYMADKKKVRSVHPYGISPWLVGDMEPHP